MDDKKFGLPKQKKYPMPDAAHVRSAIKFFNYVTPANEQELATAILARMKEYGISPESLNVGDENRFKKYIRDTYLEHHGILGQRWGVRRYQNPDGTLTAKGHQRRLQQLDSDRRNSVATATNLVATRNYSEKKAERLRSKGKIEKAQKFEKRAKDADRLAKKELDNYVRKGEEFLKAIEDVEKSGYTWKSTPTSFMSVQTTSRGEEFMKNNGLFSLQVVSNAASGNRFKVKENASDRVKERWSNQKSIQTQRPQVVVYV